MVVLFRRNSAGVIMIDPCLTCLDTSCGSFYLIKKLPRQPAIWQRQQRVHSKHPQSQTPNPDYTNEALHIVWNSEGFVCFYRIYHCTVKLKAYLIIHQSPPSVTFWWACVPSLGSYPACWVSSVDTSEPWLISCSKKLESISSSYKMLWFSLSNRFLSHARCHMHAKQVVNKKSLDRKSVV